MVINFTLAYIPFELAIFINKMKPNRVTVTGVSLIWLLFYPNAPYLLTDFFHLETLSVYSSVRTFSDSIYSWEQFTILTIGILVGTVLGIISLILVTKKLISTFKIKNQYKTIIKAGFVLVSTFLAGFAIYLGRFPRLHSHYFLTDPLYVLNKVIKSIHLESIQFSLLMMCIQIVLLFLIKNANILSAEKENMKDI